MKRLIYGAMLNPKTIFEHPKYRGMPLNEMNNKLARDGWRYYTDINKFVKVGGTRNEDSR